MTIGSWCPSYLKRLENKHSNGKITDEKYETTKAFILRKVKAIDELQAKYNDMTDEERKAYRAKFDAVKCELSEYILKIIHGRINSFRLHSSDSLRDRANLDDIVQDAYIAVISYINRYNDELCTSAFAYVTQLVTNSILFSLSEIKKREHKFITGLDFYENLNTVDDPMGRNELNKFLG